MANDPRGFVPSRHLHGLTSFRTQRFPVSADNALHVGIAKGDPVRLIGGYAVKWTAMSATHANVKALMGVVAQCLDSNEKPFTHSQPTRGPYIPSSTAGYVDVHTDPNIVFTVQCDASLPAGNIGQLIDVTAGGVNTAAGVSKMAVKFATVTVTATFPFKIIGMAPVELGKADTANNDVEVIINTHTFGQSRIAE